MYRNILSSLTGIALIRLRALSRRGSEARDLAILVDAAYYLANNPDIAHSRWSPRWHYLFFGAAERRNPHPLFDTAFYLASCPDVERSGMNPLLHYILYGALEGRRPNRTWSSPPADGALKAVSSNPLVRHILTQARGPLALTTPAPPPASPSGVAPTRRHEAVPEAAKLGLAAASRDLAQALAGCDLRVSVVVASYNYGKCVRDAIGSVLAQTYPHVEVIVVDDESSDPDTIEVLDQIRHPRVTVIRQFNQGLAQTRNNGAAAASGDFLMFLDCDDRLERHAVALLLYALRQHPSLTYAYPYQRFFGNQELVWETQAFNAYDLLWSNHPTVCSLIHRSAFEEAGGYKPEFFYGYEDWELYLRLAGRGHYGLCVPAPVFEYRRHGTSMSDSLRDRQAVGLGQMLAINSGLFEPKAITKSKSAWRPLISVIIPFYNSPRYLKETLDSLRAQSTQDFELILANDGSDDPESLHALDEMRTKGWGRVLDLPHAGLPATRNRGAQAARAELIMFLDSDDLLDPLALEKLCWTIARQPQYAFVYSGVVHFGDVQGVSYEEFDAARLHKENFLASTCVIRRDVFLELGGNDEAMIHSWEDYDFWLRLAAKGYSGRLFREPLFHYRRHSASISRNVTDGAPGKLEEISRSVVRRHLAAGEGAQLPPLISSRPPEPGLLETAAEALRAAVPPSIPTERYRRTNLPNLFCPQRWNGEKITILYLIPGFNVGGAEVFDLRIFSCLPRDQFRVVAVACDSPEGPWYDEFRIAVDEIFCLERMGDDRDGKMAFLRYLMVAKCVDIVFNRNTWYGYDLARDWPEVTKQVRYADILHLHALGEDWVRASAPYHGKLDLRYVTSDDLPHYAAREYELDPHRFKALAYGFETEELLNDADLAALRRELRREWNIAESAFVVGFAGRLTDQKDPLRWITIASKIAELDRDAVFLVVGDGELLNATMTLAAKIGLADKTIFAGYQRQAAQYPAAMDVLLMTSKYEGLPLMVLHSLAHGTPVVSSDVGGIGRCLTPRTGRVVPRDAEAEAYAAAVLEWRNILRTDRSIGGHCRELAASRFGKSQMRRHLIDDLSSLASGLNLENRRKDYQLDLMKRPVLW
jgi:glycosyltransferase involved in cell wall biosynthesis